jgi:antitoxin component of RelBE/YafQ-DinJ toxin-antitoxin module
MPIGNLATRPDVYAYPLKTNVQLRRRVAEVSKETGLSFNAVLNILLKEALDARKIPENS